MATVMLGVGELGVSNTPGDVIRTLALGSCIAVMLLEPRTRSVGMVHIALPDSSIDEIKAKLLPGYFADTGIVALIQDMKRISKIQNERKFMVKIAGGAKVLDPNNAFNIGKRNELAIKKILWSYGMGVHAEDVGGHITRSVTADIDTGRIMIVSAGRGVWEI